MTEKYALRHRTEAGEWAIACGRNPFCAFDSVGVYAGYDVCDSGCPNITLLSFHLAYTAPGYEDLLKYRRRKLISELASLLKRGLSVHHATHEAFSIMDETMWANWPHLTNEVQDVLWKTCYNTLILIIVNGEVHVAGCLPGIMVVLGRDGKDVELIERSKVGKLQTSKRDAMFNRLVCTRGLELDDERLYFHKQVSLGGTDKYLMLLSDEISFSVRRNDTLAQLLEAWDNKLGLELACKKISSVSGGLIAAIRLNVPREKVGGLVTNKDEEIWKEGPIEITDEQLTSSGLTGEKLEQAKKLRDLLKTPLFETSEEEWKEIEEEEEEKQHEYYRTTTDRFIRFPHEEEDDSHA